MSKGYFQKKQFLWGLSKIRFYRWLTLASWVLFSVLNLGILAGLHWQQLWYICQLKKLRLLKKAGDLFIST
jgi:hypothetical protein